MENTTPGIIIHGKIVDEYTRCVHYHSALDVIAVKFKCCDRYYPCYFCHQEAVNHPATVWKQAEFYVKAILCGACLREMTISAYRASNYKCPFCDTAFNPKCANHDHFYFEAL